MDFGSSLLLKKYFYIIDLGACFKAIFGDRKLEINFNQPPTHAGTKVNRKIFENITTWHQKLMLIAPRVHLRGVQAKRKFFIFTI